jgi:hypothetical protein
MQIKPHNAYKEKKKKKYTDKQKNENQYRENEIDL